MADQVDSVALMLRMASKSGSIEKMPVVDEVVAKFLSTKPYTAEPVKDGAFEAGFPRCPIWRSRIPWTVSSTSCTFSSRTSPLRECISRTAF